MQNPFRKKYRTLNTVRVSAYALKHNLNLYRKALPGREICPILKSNAYGLGLIEVAKVMEKESPAFLIVDSLYEAHKLKKAKINTPVLILGYTHAENLKMGLPYHFVASDLKMAKYLAKLKMSVHLEVDTGMARMGFSMKSLEKNLAELKKLDLNIVGAWTHLADADGENDSYTKMQEEKFAQALKMIHEAGFSPKWIHVGNSAGAKKITLQEVNMARIGLGLYGYSELQGLEAAMQLTSTLVSIRDIKKGDKVSYNCSFEAQRDMKIGTLPLGYYEALPRTLSNKEPFLGQICMNHSMIEVSPNAKIGDEVIVYGDLKEFAKKAGTIPYELMVQISESLRREVH